ncbi:MAG: hypothetical protein WD009_08670 [Phycisphaeraceae bacterium]
MSLPSDARPPSRWQLILGGALLTCAAAMLALPGQRPPADARAIILSDSDGLIEQVVCNVNSARHAALRNAELFSHIVNALPARVELITLTNDRAAFTITSNPHPDRLHFVDLPADHDFTIWTQDPFVVLREPGGSMRLAVPADFERADDHATTDRLSAHLGAPVERSDLYFEGGNIVADDRHVFIGADTIARNMLEHEADAETIVRRFAALFGRTVLVVGPSPQPVGHIDMILTPLGEGRLMLADPGAGAQLAEDALAAQPQAVADFEQRCERMFFGDPSIRELIGPGGQPIRPPDVTGATPGAVADSRSIAETYDRLAEQLAKRGYEVHRVPFLHTAPQIARDEEPPVEAAAALAAPGPGYPVLTYNNVLLERTDQAGTVYLPVYGFDVLDRAAAQAWAEAGFEVRAVPGLTTSAMYGGALRCCVKVLRRSTH